MGETLPVWRCLIIVLNEERRHRLYAERDLAVLEEVHRHHEVGFETGHTVPGTADRVRSD